MSEIRVDTSDLRNGSQSMHNAGNTIASIETKISNVTSGAGNAYDGQLRQSLEKIVSESFQFSTQLQNRSTNLGKELLSRAIGFETVNEATLNIVRKVSTSYGIFIEKHPYLKYLSFLRQLKEKAFSIWSGAGLAIGGIFSLIYPSEKLAIETPTNTSSKPKISFGDLIRKSEEERLQKEKQETQRREWWNTNGLNQRDSKVVKAMGPYGNTFNACGTTALAILINFSNFTKDKPNQTTDPASLTTYAGQQGYFKDSLLSFAELENIAKSQGFTIDTPLNANGTSPISFNDLKSKVESGNPQIVLAKYGYDKDNKYVPNPNSNFDHFVIVTSISENQVTIINSHPGKYITSNTDVKPTIISVDQFRKVWAFDNENFIGQGFGIKTK